MNVSLKNSITDSSKRHFYEMIGHILILERQFSNYHGRSDFWLNNWLIPALSFEQVQIFYTEQGVPIGFIAWAYLEADVRERVVKAPQSSLHPSEWTESKQPWIIDLVVLKPFVKKVLQQAAKTIFSDFETIGLVRRRHNGDIKRLTTVKNKFYGACRHELV